MNIFNWGCKMNVGMKFDDNKIKWNLINLKIIEPIVKVLMFGANKYSENNWKKVSKPKQRYYAALIRHISAWHSGEKIDAESGQSHLAHAGCCLYFLLWFDKGKFDETR